jgi:hypothetical protein
MKFTLEALDRLTAEQQVIRHRATLPLVDGRQACRILGNTLEKFRQSGATIKVDRPKLDVRKVWNSFAAASFECDSLNELEFRALCSSEETALRPEFIRALEQVPEKLKRPRCLYGLVNNYFALWREMPQPDLVERLLRTAFESYGGRNPVVREWSLHKSLFSDQAAMSLAEAICVRQDSVDEVLKTYCVSPLTKLGLKTRSSAALTSGQRFRQLEVTQDEKWCLGYLQWVTERILSDLTSADAFYATIGQLILSLSAKRSDAFRRALRIYIQHHKRLGDPRLRESSPNWRSMVPEASQRYLSWLARDSILFFFNTILPNTNENRRRKDFWLRYHDAIKDFQVAVSEEDLWKLKSGIKSSDQIAYSRVDHPTTSAFLMQFEGYGTKYLIVEFSETGNAAYIFKLADFERRRVSLRSPRFDLKKHLKFDKERRILHVSNWEAAAASMLSSDFGIRP